MQSGFGCAIDWYNFQRDKSQAGCYIDNGAFLLLLLEVRDKKGGQVDAGGQIRFDFAFVVV